MSAEIKKKIESLREKILRHDHLYYVLSQPLVSDKEYDDLLKKLIELETQFSQLRQLDSPSQRVGSKASSGVATVRHKEKMLSLDNTYSVDELKEWVLRVRKGLGKGRV